MVSSVVTLMNLKLLLVKRKCFFVKMLSLGKCFHHENVFFMKMFSSWKCYLHGKVFCKKRFSSCLRVIFRFFVLSLIIGNLLFWWIIAGVRIDKRGDYHYMSTDMLRVRWDEFSTFFITFEGMSGTNITTSGMCGNYNLYPYGMYIRMDHVLCPNCSYQMLR